MASTNNTLSPQLLSVLFEMCAEGRVKPSALLSQVQNNVPLMYNDSSVVFTKTGVGAYEVTLTKDGVSLASERCATPTEAKLVALEFITAQAKPQPKKAHKDAMPA